MCKLVMPRWNLMTMHKVPLDIHLRGILYSVQNDIGCEYVLLSFKTINLEQHVVLQLKESGCDNDINETTWDSSLTLYYEKISLFSVSTLAVSTMF